MYLRHAPEPHVLLFKVGSRLLFILDNTVTRVGLMVWWDIDCR